MVSRYADVIKASKDLLSKSFSYNNSVEVKATTNSGVVFTADAAVSKPVSASLKAEAKVGDVKIDSLKIGTDRKIAGEFSLSNAFPGTKLSFKGTDGSRAAGADAITAVIGAEYTQQYSTLTLDVDCIAYGVDATALVNYDGVLVGASVKASLASASGFDLRDYNALLGYKAKDFTVSVQTEKKAANVTAAVYQIISPDISAAATAKFPLSPKASVSGFDIELGLQWRLNADTTVVSKVNSAGKVASSFASSLSPVTKLTIAAEIDAANISSDEHKFGLKLNVLH